MKKFMALYMAPRSVIEQMMNVSPEQMKEGMDQWMKWYEANKASVVDLGAPLGRTKRITGSGASDSKNEIAGYSIVQGNSADAAAKIFNGHPHLQMGGASIDLIECMPTPGM